MHAEFENLSGIIRIFEDGKNYGDEYGWAVTVRYLDKETVEFLGITKAPTISQWRAIEDCCREEGIKTIVFYRILNDGTKKEHVLDLERNYEGEKRIY